MATRILLLAGTTAPAAAASLLAAAFAREIAYLDAEPTLVALTDYPLPLFDPGPPAPTTIPHAAARLRSLVHAHHGIFVTTPSHDGLIPALLANALEWLGANDGFGRAGPPPFAIGATAADSWSAGNALAALSTAVARGLGATLVGGGIAVGQADNAFDSKGRLDDPRHAATLTRMARALIDIAQIRSAND